VKPQKFQTSSVKAAQSVNMRIKSSPMAKSADSEQEDTLKDQLEDILEAGKERFNKAMDAWAKNRMDALADLKFYRGDQWSQDLQRVGAVRKEPTLTVNRFPQFVKQVENELRNQSISLNVYPTDEVGSEETAQVFAGIIRDIERKSYAQSAYIHAAGESGAMVPGFGFLKLETVYSGQRGFNQEIRISSPHDPFLIVPDGDAVEPDSSDATCWFEFDDYSVDAYKKAFPHSEMATLDLQVYGSKLSSWVGGEGIRVVKYWYKEENEVIEYLMEDGSVVNNIGFYDPNEDQDEREEARGPDADKKAGKLSQKAVLRTRSVIDTKVKWVIFNGVEVLEHGEWADNEFPFVSIYGPTLIVDGERDIRGIIRHAKDSQKMLNYMASSAVRRIGSANKAPWIVDIKSIKGYENQWKTANTENWSMLPYNSTDPDNNNRQLTPPTRADQTGQINDLLAAASKFEGDLKATIGIYDAGLGATPNEQSGVAIKTLAQQGQNSNYHFSDALQRGIQRLGYLLIRLIPKIYDTARVVRIIGDDSQERLVKINQIFVEGGEQKMHDLGAGEYGVAVSAGPAYATRKSQALEQIIKLVGGDPAVMPFIQDILVGEMDFDKAPVIQERLRKLLALKAPQLLEQDEQAPVPPQAQAAIAQQQNIIQSLTQELQAMQQELQKLHFEKATKQIDHEQQKAIIVLKNQADLAVEQARAQVATLKAENENKTTLIKAHLDHSAEMTQMAASLAKEGHLQDIVNPGSLG
jgi:hypothetical protein